MFQTVRQKNPKAVLFFILAALMMLALVPAVSAVDLTGNMNTSRPVKVGADECYRTLTNITNGAAIKALARNANGSWVFIWADVGDGWVPTSSVNLAGNVMSLSVWTDHFNGEACAAQPQPVDSRICGRDGNTINANTTRWTDIFNTADPDTETGRAYPPNTGVTINGRDFWGCWVQVDGAGDSGWIPVDSLNNRGVMGRPILVDNSGGCTIEADGRVLCPTP